MSLRIQRFDFAERVSHWLSAGSYVYAALTGLALWSHKLYWIASIFGGGPAARSAHPWAGVLFFLALGVMFQRWASQMRLDANDRVWLKSAHKYAMHEDDSLPPPGRFNAGQKMLFWTQAALSVALLISGLVLWFPVEAPRSLRLAAVLVHPLAAIGSLAGIIVHIYMGTAGVPGSMRAMIQGWVTPEWARAHHRSWHPRGRAD